MKRKISVFIASPGDLATERSAFKNAIKQLNVGFGDGANVEFVPLGWEDTLASTGRRSQGVINTEIDKCDVFILAMHRRWGQEAPDAKPYTSYTEEEFHRALDRWEKNAAPEIFVFFKRVDAASEADPGPQLKKVIDFRKHLEDTRQILYHYFDDEAGFINEVDRHLRAYAKGELPEADQQQNIVILPSALLEEVNKAKAYAVQKAMEAEQAHDDTEKALLKLELMQLQIAQDAAALSREGKIEYARQKFSELIMETADIRILYLGYEFFYRTGDLNSAFKALNTWLNISGAEQTTPNTANVYCNLGILYRTKGEIEKAEEMFWKALVIDEALGRKDGIATHYGNLGSLYQTKGELEQAEKMYREALVIDEALGRKDGIATHYGNLGILYQRKGKLEQAEEMYRKSLTINEALDYKEGISHNYDTLGVLYGIKGEIEKAQEMFRKALAIDEVLGYKEGMATHYGNLGILYQSKGKLEQAEEMHRKSLTINEALDYKAGIARNYGNLGNLYLIKVELEQAEEMYRKALAIEEALGCKEGMASAYGNLGNLYQTRGELDRAEEMYKKALPLFSALKSPLAEVIRKWLKGLR